MFLKTVQNNANDFVSVLPEQEQHRKSSEDFQRTEKIQKIKNNKNVFYLV